MAGIAILSSFPSQAADAPKTNAELEAENARLNAENARLLQMIEALKQSQPPAAAASTAPASNAPVEAPAEPAVADAEKDGAKTLEGVVVQGRRKAPLEKLKDVPQSISVVSGQELERQQTTNFRDVLKKVGNVKWGGSSTNPTTTALTLRGVGYLGTGGALGIDSSVNTTVDGVPYIISNMAVFNSYYDLDTVDVARGPQGTSGGYSASLGKISFASKGPSFNPEAGASITYGAYNTLLARGYAGGGIVPDLLAWRGTFYREQQEGYFDNDYYRSKSNGGNEVKYGNIDRTYGRLQFLLTPTEDFKARFSFDYTPNSKEYGISSNGGIYPKAVPDFFDSLDANGNRIAVNQANQDTGKLTRRWFTQNANWTYGGNYLRESNRAEHYPIANETKGLSANLNWKVNGYDLTAITAWRDYHFDFGSPNFSNPTPFDILRGPSSGLGYFRQSTGELRITSPTGGLFDYQAGVFYADVFRSNGGEGRGNKFGSDSGAYFATLPQYNRLDVDGNGRYLMANSLNGLKSNSYNEKDDNTLAFYGSLKWNITDKLALNTGLRISHEERTSDVSYNKVYDQGNAAELNPVAVNNVALGGFNSNATSGNLTTNNAAQLALANFTAQKYFGKATYSALSDSQKRQIADAKAIRAARLAGLYDNVKAEAFDKVLYTANFSPTYKITDNHTGYFSFQYGEKAGVSQIVGATRKGGTSRSTKPEKNFSYEIGLRSQFFGGSLAVNTTLFYQSVKDYIANLYFYDEAQTIANNDGLLAYISGVGNIPEVSSKGVELDISYSVKNTSFRFSGAYNDARYEDEKFHAKPLELGGTSVPYYDVSGRRLPGVGPLTFNVFAEHVWPVFGSFNFFANANYNYTSGYLTDPSLSRYSRVDAYGLTDASIGIGTQDRKFEVSLLAKNLFDVDYGYQPVWNLYIPGAPRWVGLTVSSQFY
ncbi:TonB-dependent receptor domain-containing protein [Methylococcus sp. EFPC2]|uniref:TonB-dependent receptor domain-containing protein n=1 Tax=Methylococcus sp. EFPC2 TaxID=2812648 RepID=UPI001966FCAF|nr:TonB-dependent receptor [Methylococcus sp. EFPC2]QSA98952.1 TonB-dependent receptor [Methylococcus sp. EFPC2]